MMLQKSARHGYVTLVGNVAKPSDEPLTRERKRVIRIATELCYGKHVIARLKNAKSSWELSQIMEDARRGKI